MKTMVNIIKVMIISMGVLSMVSCDDDYAEVEKTVMASEKSIETPKKQEGGGNKDPEGGG